MQVAMPLSKQAKPYLISTYVYSLLNDFNSSKVTTNSATHSFIRSALKTALKKVHRMGTMEIESALVSCTELVAEAAVVGRPDDTTGEAICAFVVLKRALPSGDEGKAIAKQLRDHIAKEIGPIAKPKDIRFGENLPKTRSGKIMRRLLRSLAKGEEITQDISTLENPAILGQLGQAY
jgi:acetyl-CoA synthetase